MADQLLEQVREYAEGQIVSSAPPVPNNSKTNMDSQDFEGQKLAELMATALLATAGVSLVEFLRTIDSEADNVAGHLIHRWILAARHQACSLPRSRRNCNHIPARCTTMAILQQTSCQMVTCWGR